MDINDYVRHNLHMPGYFNENRYNVLPQCQNVNEAERLWTVYNGYHDMLQKLSSRFHELGVEYTKKASQNMIKRAEDALALKELSNPPFFAKAMYAWEMR